jgi:peptide/nickel transport system permease protein
MVITFFVLTVAVFIIIQLPPGDFLTSLVAALEEQGAAVDQAELAALKKYYGLDTPPLQQYFRWITRFLAGDMGFSFEWQLPVNALIAERLPYTLLISGLSLVFVYATAVPIGIYAATHQYNFGDYALTILGFIGLATPGFMLALILMFFFFKYFGISLGGLFSSQYAMAPWSAAKLWDLIQHLWVPVIVVGMAGTAGIIRVMRATLLDELRKQYVITARAKGCQERRLLFKYPVRVAINPIVSTIGWQLPNIVSGATITSVVLNLPTVGLLLYRSLISQDMFMAGSAVMILGMLTLIGTLLSDILLVVIDPRIRYEKKRA